VPATSRHHRSEPPAREHDREQAVLARDRVAERVDPARGIDGGGIGVREQHAAGADRARHQPLPGDAGTDRGGRVVSPARGDRDPRWQAEVLSNIRRKRPGGLGALEHVRQPPGRDAERVEDLAGPRPPRQIQEQGPRGVGGVGREPARQPVADVVLRQQHALDPRERVRLLVAEPQDLRRLEPGERGVAGDLDQPALADGFRDGLALPRGALVVPQQRRPDHVARGIQEYRAVHLAGQPDARHGLAGSLDLPCDRREHLPNTVPPAGGILLGPLGPRREQRVLG
jgi:hypothetical protein